MNEREHRARMEQAERIERALGLLIEATLQERKALQELHQAIITELRQDSAFRTELRHEQRQEAHHIRALHREVHQLIGLLQPKTFKKPVAINVFAITPPG